MDNSTWMLILLILMLAVILINYWAVEDTLFLPASFSTLIIMASVLGVVLQYGANAMAIERGYEVIVAGTFLFLEMFSYYLLYALSNRTRENMELAAIEQQQHLDEELLQSFHDNLESMHMIRHEIRNHMAYIRVLVAQEEYDKLFDYTNSVLGEAEVLFTTVSSGNDVVDAVVNHGIQKAQKAGITVRASVVAPPVLPFAEKDFCSILSNLMDNALEAASASGKPDPVLEVSIRPQQDYLFIRVTNPVSEEVSRRGLSLRTTKKEAALHGYGTRIVRYLTERYHGSVQYELKDGIFIADVMLDLNAGPEADSARRTASL